MFSRQHWARSTKGCKREWSTRFSADTSKQASVKEGQWREFYVFSLLSLSPHFSHPLSLHDCELFFFVFSVSSKKMYKKRKNMSYVHSPSILLPFERSNWGENVAQHRPTSSNHHHPSVLARSLLCACDRWTLGGTLRMTWRRWKISTSCARRELSTLLWERATLEIVHAIPLLLLAATWMVQSYLRKFI